MPFAIPDKDRESLTGFSAPEKDMVPPTPLSDSEAEEVSSKASVEKYLGERYKAAPSMFGDGYRMTVPKFGFNGLPSADYRLIREGADQRNSARRAAREFQTLEGRQKANALLIEATKDVPLMGWAARAWVKMDEVATIAVSSAVETGSKAVKGIAEQARYGTSALMYSDGHYPLSRFSEESKSELNELALQYSKLTGQEQFKSLPGILGSDIFGGFGRFEKTGPSKELMDLPRDQADDALRIVDRIRSILQTEGEQASRTEFDEGNFAQYAESAERFGKEARRKLGVNEELAATTFGQIVSAIGQLPVFAGSFAVNPALGIAVSESVIFDEAIEEYEAHADNPNPSDALKFAALVTVPSVLVELGGAERVFGSIFRDMKSAARREILKRLAFAVPKEGIEESVQGAILDFFASEEFEDGRKVLTGDGFDRRLSEFTIGSVAALFGSSALSLPFIGKGKGAERGDFAKHSWDAIKQAVTLEQTLAEVEGENARELVEMAYNGDLKAQEAFRLIAEQEFLAREEAVDGSLLSKEEIEAIDEYNAQDPSAFDPYLSTTDQVDENSIEQFRQEESQQALEDTVDFDSELLEVVKSLGGLIRSDREPALGGEIARIRDNLKETKAISGIFKREAKQLDPLRRSLEEHGFFFETPADMLKAIDSSATGIEHFPMAGGGIYTRPREARDSSRVLDRTERIKVEKSKVREVYKKKLVDQKERLARKLDAEVRRRTREIERRFEERKNLTQAMRELEGVVAQIPISVRGKFKGFGTLSTKVSKDAQKDFLKNSVQRANAIITDYQRRTIRDRIEAKAKAVEKVIANARRMKRKSPVSSREWERFKGGIGFASKKDIENATQAVNEYLLLSEIDSAAEPAENHKEALETLGRPQIGDKSATVEWLANVEADIDAFIAGKRSRLQVIEDRRAAELQRDEAKLHIELAEANDKRGRAKFESAIDPDGGPVENGLKFLRGLDLQMIAPETMGRMATAKRDGGEFHKAVFLPIFEAADAKAKGLREINETLERFREKSGITHEAAAREVIIDIAGTPLTAQHAMAIYGYAQNKRGREHLLGTALPDGSKIGNEFIEFIDSALPKKYRDFVDDVIGWYDTDQFAKVNKYFHGKHGVELPKESRYLPILNLDGASAETDVFRDFSEAVLFEKGFLKGRVMSKLGFAKLDLIGNVVKNLVSVEHLVNMEPVVTRANVLLNKDAVRKELRRYDPIVASEIAKYLKRVAQDRVPPSNEWLDRAVDWLRRNASISWTAVNIGSWLKVPMSFSAGSQLVRKSELMQASIRFAMNPKEIVDFAAQRSEFVRGYENTFNRELREMLDSRKVQTALGERKLRDRYIDASYFVARMLTKAQVSTLWTAKYAEVINDGGTHTKARQEADRLVRDSQPTGRLEDLPAAYASGAWWKAFTTFTIDINKNYNLFRGIRDTEDPKALSYIAFSVFSIIAPALIGAFSDLANDEAKVAMGIKERGRNDGASTQFGRDSARYAATQVYGSHPLLNNAVEWLAARSVGDEKEAYYLANRKPTVMSAAASAMKGDFAFGAATALGLPGSAYWARPLQERIEEFLED